jgi:hypothetical protein
MTTAGPPAGMALVQCSAESTMFEIEGAQLVAWAAAAKESAREEVAEVE